MALSFAHAYPQLSSSLPHFPLLDLCPRPILEQEAGRDQIRISGLAEELSIWGAP